MHSWWIMRILFLFFIFFSLHVEGKGRLEQDQNLKIIRTEYPELLPFVDQFSLSHLKIVGDLKKVYGDRLKNMKIAEFGGGMKEAVKMLCVGTSYTVIDDKMLDGSDQFDLFLCNADCLPKLEIFEKVIKLITHGYVAASSDQNFDIDAFLSILLRNGRKGTIVQNSSNTEHLIITWKPSNENPSLIRKGKNGFEDCAVTYDFSGGRFGDNLLSYFHAKWIAFQYGLPFFYKPFPHSENLLLSTIDEPIKSKVSQQHTLRITDEQQFLKSQSNTLFVVPYFTESKFEYEMLNHKKEGMPFFEVDWENPEFRAEIVQCLMPTIPIDYVELPPDCVTVAAHVRRGGEYETYAEGARGYPLKFPPDNYYIDQIKLIAEIYKDKPIYVHIFTDALQPQNIVKSFSEALKNPRITIRTKSSKKRSKGSTELFNDFYSIGKFDCLIRSTSNFSVMASLLGDYSLMFTPTHAHFNKRKVVIDQIEIKFNDREKK